MLIKVLIVKAIDTMIDQMVNDLPAMQETQVRYLERGVAIYFSILTWRIPWTDHGVAKSQTLLSDFHTWFFQ